MAVFLIHSLSKGRDIVEYKPTTSSAIEFASANRIEDWIHLFLCGEGNNIPFSEGLKLEPRNYYAPKMMLLNQFERCCGPEENMTFRVPEDNFIKRVGGIAEFYSTGDWDMPPLIIYLHEGAYVLSDGNHRFEALTKLGIDSYWVIIWETSQKA